MVSEKFVKQVEPLLFPIKLYKLAHSEEIKSVFWSREGTAIMLDTELLPKECFENGIFRVADCKHVFRQLSYYQFYRIQRIGQVWEFQHPQFLADRFDLVEAIRRPGKKNRKLVEVKTISPYIETRKSARLQKKEKEEPSNFDFFEDVSCKEEDGIETRDTILESVDKNIKGSRRGRKRKDYKTKSAKKLNPSAEQRTSHCFQPAHTTGGKDLNLVKLSLQKDDALKPFTRSQKIKLESPKLAKENSRTESTIKVEDIDPSRHATIVDVSTEQTRPFKNSPETDLNEVNLETAALYLPERFELLKIAEPPQNKQVKQEHESKSIVTKSDESYSILGDNLKDSTNVHGKEFFVETEIKSLNNAISDGMINSETSQGKSSNVLGYFVLDNVYNWMPVDKNTTENKYEPINVIKEESNFKTEGNVYSNQFSSVGKTIYFPNNDPAVDGNTSEIQRAKTCEILESCFLPVIVYDEERGFMDDSNLSRQCAYKSKDKCFIENVGGTTKIDLSISKKQPESSKLCPATGTKHNPSSTSVKIIKEKSAIVEPEFVYRFEKRNVLDDNSDEISRKLATGYELRDRCSLKKTSYAYEEYLKPQETKRKKKNMFSNSHKKAQEFTSVQANTSRQENEVSFIGKSYDKSSKTPVDRCAKVAHAHREFPKPGLQENKRKNAVTDYCVKVQNEPNSSIQSNISRKDQHISNSLSSTRQNQVNPGQSRVSNDSAAGCSSSSSMGHLKSNSENKVKDSSKLISENQPPVQEKQMAPQERKELVKSLYYKFKNDEMTASDMLDTDDVNFMECAYEALTLDIDIALSGKPYEW